MKKQTTVEWLVNELIKKGFPIEKYGIDLINQAKEKEKEQIIDAVNYGFSDWGGWKDSEEYYTSTYGQ